MASFQFTVIDQAGQPKHGKLDAESQDDAVARLSKDGLRVLSISLIDEDIESRMPLPRPSEPPRLHIGLLNLVLSGAALIVSLSTLSLVLFRDPLGSGIKKYDFSTPAAALKSTMQIDQDLDIRAVIELESRVKGKQNREKLATLEVRREAEHGGKKILFVTCKADGVNKYWIEGFEKDVNTGYWLPSPVSEFSVEKGNKALAAQMRRWQESGDLSKKESDAK